MSSEPWAAEMVVSAEQAGGLIEGQFPQLAPARAELIGVGWDNSAFLVNGTYVFRFPRRGAVVPSFEAETRLMPALAPRLPVPVPSPTFVGRPAGGFPWPFAGYRVLPGRTACALDLDDGARQAAAAPLGRFLAALHAIPAGEAEALGAGPDTLGRLDLAMRVPWALGLLERAVERGLVDEGQGERFAALLDAAPQPYEPRARALVHGDLYVRHLIFEGGRLTGVIDWGDVHLGDPAVDLAIAHTFLPPSAHEAFRLAYGPIDDATWRLARLRGLWHTLAVAIFSREINDADLEREAGRALGDLAAC